MRLSEGEGGRPALKNQIDYIRRPHLQSSGAIHRRFLLHRQVGTGGDTSCSDWVSVECGALAPPCFAATQRGTQQQSPDFIRSSTCRSVRGDAESSQLKTFAAGRMHTITALPVSICFSGVAHGANGIGDTRATQPNALRYWVMESHIDDSAVRNPVCLCRPV